MALQVSCSALTQWSLTLTLTSAPYPQRVSSSHGKSSSESRSFFLPLLPDPNPPLGYCLPSSLAGVQRHAMPRPAFACPANVVLVCASALLLCFALRHFASSSLVRSGPIHSCWSKAIQPSP
ncbi:hypothetical protein CTAM01_04582 [Colletotrichum tamarilloi]|uniref:Uncharacterized protein n=1 Tax=Colletotrichum tamarilloi TaxID=1209934 RepID=A0ABQ9RHE4_9PEZI|nr:uncharacterized protein CTAM01_04582 [Colletotrichum tamarilloi]KAK1503270.1 hypothetical protein CTAM01_04582 [Colletotrichum tamarilloi]